MAKRRRLSPLDAVADPAAGSDTGADTGAAGPLEIKAHIAQPLAPMRPAPIADMAGAAAATAALEEMAATLRAAREGGRMVVALPLGQVDAGHLVRDRIAVDADEMAALVESLRARGQQTPIEVEQTGPDRYGLISGWRRLRALHLLQAETGDARFGLVLALLRRPEQAADAYVAMVEENEIRVGLSFYERARIVDRAVAGGVFADDRAGLRALFGAASRAKRSKIGSFLAVVRALDGHLRFPEAIGERLGLQLAQGLESDPGLAARLIAVLDQAAPADAVAEQALLARALSAGAAKPPPAPRFRSELRPGLRLEARPGRLVIEGKAVDADLAERLVAWLSRG